MSLARKKIKVNYLMFMDDLKLYGEKELDLI